MAKKRSRRPAPAPVAEVDESNVVVREEEMLRDEIDDQLLSRDQIRWVCSDLAYFLCSCKESNNVFVEAI